MLRLGRCRVDVALKTVMMVDSLEMTDAGRAAILAECRQAPREPDRRRRTAPTPWSRRARLLAEGQTGKTIVLTGAMVPYAFGSSDGLFNLGSALSFAQVLPARRLRRDEWALPRRGRERARTRRRASSKSRRLDGSSRTARGGK